MSYIRSISNPEELYIWSNGDIVTIMMGSKTIGNIPVSVFNGLIKRWIERCFEDCTYNKASINSDNNKDCKVELKYKDINISMYYVTWYFIAVSNYKSIKKVENYYKRKKRNEKISNN